MVCRVFIACIGVVYAQDYEIVYTIDVSGKTGKAIKDLTSTKCKIYIKDDKVMAKFSPKIPEVADILIDGGQNKVYCLYPNDTLIKDLYLLTPERSSHQYYSPVGKEYVAGRECTVWTGEIDAPHLGGKATHTIWVDPNLSPKIETARLIEFGSPFWTPGVKGFPLKKKIVFSGMDLTVVYTAIQVRNLKIHDNMFVLPQNPKKFSPDRNVADTQWVEIETKRRAIARIMTKTSYLRALNIVSEPPKFTPFLLPTYLIFD